MLRKLFFVLGCCLLFAAMVPEVGAVEGAGDIAQGSESRLVDGLAASVGDPETADAADSGPDLLSHRERIAAGILGAIIAISLLSFFSSGRVSERFHVALSLVVLLIAAFGILLLMGTSGHLTGLLGGLAFIGLVGVCKLMNQFEITRKR